MVRNLVSVFGVFVLIIAVSFAQPPQDRGSNDRLGPGGPPGFGIPGLGALGFGGLPNSGFILLMMPEVRKELRIDEEQNPAIVRLIEETQSEIRASMSQFNPADLFDLDEDERRERIAELRRPAEKAVKNANERVNSILTKEQQNRLRQLVLQRDGVAALLKSEIVEDLGLSHEQVDKLREIDEKIRPSFGGPRGPGGFGGRDGERNEQLRRQGMTDALALLTESQQKKKDDLFGKPFEFPQPTFGRGGPGGMRGQERKLVSKFDHDGNGWLNQAERKLARESAKNDRPAGGFGFGPFGGRGPGGPPGGPRRENREPAKPGMKVAVESVKYYPDAELYDQKVLRTIFIQFENVDWEAELADFHNTDVEVPATMTVDGTTYSNVGVHFRGNSSYMMVPAGYKRSFNIAMDLVDKEQRLRGYKTLNLLNSNEDPSFLSSVLYSHIARQHIPAPKANLVRVVINGEDWGIYANVQQFNKEFLAENYASAKGARWKVPGSPGGGGGLDFIGDDIEQYKRRYEIKSGDSDKSWKKLVNLCKTLDQTATADLPKAIEPILDVDALLWFLALDNALINSDGYWVRASDYSIYLDEKDRFHIIPHDMNEAFRSGMMGPPGGGFGGPGNGGPEGRRRGRPEGQGADGPPPRNRDGGGPDEDRAERRRRPGEPPRNDGPGEQGPGGGPRGAERGPRGGGLELDPLIGMDDTRKPLRSKILAVPEYRDRYLKNVREIADKSLDWKNLGPVVGQFRELINDEVKADTRKLESYDAFLRVTADEAPKEPVRGREVPLRAFADQRRAYLMNYPDIKKLAP